MKRALVAAFALAAACGETAIPLPAAKRAPQSRAAPAVDRENRLDLTRGAVVVHRTGELKLSASALHAIDGNNATAWSTPPGDPRQSATIELPAPVRLSKVGFSVGDLANPSRAAKEISFESSLDGVAFRPLAVASFPRPEHGQTVDVPPQDVRFLRATIVSNLGGVRLTDVLALVAYGKETAAPRRAPIGGAWMLNRSRARFTEREGRVAGEVEMNPSMHLDGSWDAAHVRFIWVRGEKQAGVGLLAVNPNGDRLNGVWFFEEAFPIFSGEAWFGEKESSIGEPRAARVAEEFFRRRNRLIVYDPEAGAAAVAELIRANASRRLRLVAHEFRGNSPEENRTRARAALDRLQAALKSHEVDLASVDFVVAGSDQFQKPASTVEESLFSRIVLEPAK